MVFDITLNNELDVPLNIEAFTEDGTATAGVDYRATRETLYFDGNAGETRQLTVDVYGDEIDEYDETLTLGLTELEAFGREARLTLSSGTGTILSDDIPAFDITSISREETDSGDIIFEFAVALEPSLSDPGPVGPVDITIETVNGTAYADAGFNQNDYVHNSQVLSFSGGLVCETHVFTVVVHGDNTVELDEFFNVVISDVTAYGPEQLFALRHATGPSPMMTKRS